MLGYKCEKNITHSKNFPTFSFPYTKGGARVHVQYFREIILIISLEEEKLLVPIGFVNESTTCLKVPIFPNDILVLY